MDRFFSDKVKIPVVYFGLFESSLHSRGKTQFKMLVAFSFIFVADVKIIFVSNFVAPLRQTKRLRMTLKNLVENLIQKAIKLH